jgi:hypothetical protein
VVDNDDFLIPLIFAPLSLLLYSLPSALRVYFIFSTSTLFRVAYTSEYRACTHLVDTETHLSHRAQFAFRPRKHLYTHIAPLPLNTINHGSIRTRTSLFHIPQTPPLTHNSRTPPQALHPPTPPPAATPAVVKQQTITATPPPPHPKTPTIHPNKAPINVVLCPSNNKDTHLSKGTCLNRDMEVRREVSNRCIINSNSRGTRRRVVICSSSGRSRVVGLEVFVLVY